MQEADVGTPPIDRDPRGAPEVTAGREEGRWVLVFRRHLRHAPERVWAALTDPSQLQEWAPFDASRDLGSVGAAVLVHPGDSPERSEITVRIANRPTLLEYTWDADVLRWELESLGTNGTRLTLRHYMGDPSWLPRVAAGWDICLAVADRYLSGAPIGRKIGEAAKELGWEDLRARYTKELPVAEG